ncbi:MAG: flagellar hook-length control protein FliK [Aeromonas sobria]
MALADEAVLVAWLAQLEQALADPNGQAGQEEALSQLLQRLAQQQQAGQLSPVVLQDVQRLVGDLLATAGQPMTAQLQGLRQQLMALVPTQPATVSLTNLLPLSSSTSLSATDIYKGFSQLAERVEGGAGLARLEVLKTLTELVNLRQLQAQHQPGLTGLGEFSPLPVVGQSMAMHGAAQPHQFAQISLDHSTTIANQLFGPLSDRLRVQTQLGVQQANLRLDPPELGKLDLQVRTEGDRVYVLIQAANPTVREQLLQLTDRLRQDLMADSFNQVEVDVGSFDDSQNGNQQRQENFQAEETVLAAQADRQGAATRQRQQGWDFYV